MRSVTHPERTKAPRHQPKQARSKLLVQAVDTVRDYAIFILDSRGYVLTWNLGAENLKGYTPQEIIGKHFSIFYPQEAIDRAYPDYELRQTKKLGRFEDEGWRIRKDGTQFWASVIITKLMDTEGRLIGFTKVTRDLTERRRAEEKLIEAEERFRLLVENVKDYAIFMLSPEGNIVSWNEGARRIKGYEQREIIGKHFSTFYPEEDIVSGKPAYELEEARLTGRFEDEGWRVRKDGSLLWANVVITAIRDQKKGLLGFSKVTRDLTERKRAESKIQRAYEDLEKKVEERTHELSLANAQLEESIRGRDEFLSIASHELKTPITSLKIQIQMLKSKTKPELGEIPPPERVAKSLEVSLRQIDRLTELVEELLDVARAQSKKVAFRFECDDLAALAREVVMRLAHELNEAKCVVRLNSEESVFCQFDRFRMDQVLVNLLTNAIKYAPGTPIDLSIKASDRLVRVSVRDQGPGIPPEMRKAIFDRFVRATHARSINGLGLGLYITKQIIEGHQGSIRVESDPGVGTTFVFEFPRYLDHSPEQENRADLH